MEKPLISAQQGTAIGRLARDGNGNLVALPEQAAGWRVRRQTGGRPRLYLDSNHQPMVFPLESTVADAEQVLPPGGYRLDLIDDRGEPLDVTVVLTLGVARSGDETERDGDLDVLVESMLSPASNLRAVLTASLRAVQMAFLQHQKMLEINLRLVEILRDSVQVFSQQVARADRLHKEDGPAERDIEFSQ